MKRLNKIKVRYFIIIIAILIIYAFLASIIPTFMRYYAEVSGRAVAHGLINYVINYELNNGIQANGQIEYYNAEDLPITLLVPTRAGYTFVGWYENSDFSGESILTIDTPGNYTLYANWYEGNVVAEVNGNYFTTLQAAVDAVPENNTETTVKILKDIALPAVVSVSETRNVKFNFQDYTISNAVSNMPIFEVFGQASISNGNIRSSGSQGAINVKVGGYLTVSGGSIIVSGKRQAIYNEGGTLIITGNSYLASTSTATSDIRAVVHNLAGGTLIVTGGTIVSNNFYGINNLGTLTIGVHEGDVNESSPMIQGATYGVYTSTAFSFYDGILKGVTNAVNNENRISGTEELYALKNGTETINGKTYKTLYLANEGCMVRFNANGGTVGVGKRVIREGDKLGPLPTTTYPGHAFDGWYTLPVGGTAVTENTIINESMEIFAHWIDGSAAVARIGDIYYLSMQKAIDAATKNTQTTVVLLKDISEELITIAAGKNIVFDLQNYTITNITSTNIVVNNGTLAISNGTLSSNADAGIINNNKGANLTITGGNFVTSGKRQTIYNDGGTCRISGNAYFISISDSAERGTVHNKNSGTLIITGGTIISNSFYAVHSENGTTTIGTKDGSVIGSPVMQGYTFGVNNESTFNFYDGTIYGRTSAISGTVSNVETGYTVVEVDELVDSTLYKKAYLDVVAQNEPQFAPPPNSQLQLIQEPVVEENEGKQEQESEPEPESKSGLKQESELGSGSELQPQEESESGSELESKPTLQPELESKSNANEGE